jgi:acetyl-CoA C-acetyltransferase
MRGAAPLSYVHGVGIDVSWQDARSNLSELIFRAVRSALAASGCSIGEVDSVVLSAHDLVDGRSLSSMVTAPAAGAYLKDEIRLVEDGLAAVSLASARIEAGECDLSIVAAWGRASEGGFAHTTRAAFDPFLEQPFGLDEFTLSALRLSDWMRQHGPQRSARDRAIEARAARARRNVRSVGSEVRPGVNFPLQRADAPRLADIVVAAILGRKPAAVHIAGVGHGAETSVIGGRALARMDALRAAVAAVGAGPAATGRFDLLQLGGATLADEALALEALGFAAPGQAFDAYADMAQVNPSGGGESAWCYPANGLLGFAESYLQLTNQAGAVQLPGNPARALVTGSSPMGGQVTHAVALAAS